jgi:hypothetical protein
VPFRKLTARQEPRPPGLDVIHLLVLGGGFVGLVDELFEGELVENLVGGFGELLVEEADGDFAGGHFGGDAAFTEGEASFELADEVADDDLARGAGEAVAAFAADFAFEESAAAEGEEDGLEELGGEVLVFGQVAGLDVVARAHPRQLHDGSESVFGLLGKAQEPLLDAGKCTGVAGMVWEEEGCSKPSGNDCRGMTNDEIRMKNEIRNSND